MASRKVDDLLRNYEHTHVREELGEWIKEGGKPKHTVCAKNESLFKFKMHQSFKKGVIGEYEHTRTVEMPCFAIEQRSLVTERTLPGAMQHTMEITERADMSSSFDSLYEFIEKKTGKPAKPIKNGDVQTRMSSLPDTLFISINRMYDEGLGKCLDPVSLQIPVAISFEWDSYKKLLAKHADPRRYTLVGMIVAEYKGERGGVLSVDDLETSAFAIVWSPGGKWYRINRADDLRMPTLHGQQWSDYAVREILSGERSYPESQMFVLRLYYRASEHIIATPSVGKYTRFRPARFPRPLTDLFDSGPEARECALNAVVASITKDLADNHCLSMIEVMQKLPPLDEFAETGGLDVGVGPGIEMPTAVLKILDERTAPLIGRAVFEVFRLRSLLAVLHKFFSHAPLIGHGPATACAMVKWVQKEWKALSDDRKHGWIIAADYFNIVFEVQITQRKPADVFEKKERRVTAFDLFTTQWPVLVGTRISAHATMVRDQKIIADPHLASQLTPAQLGLTEEDRLAIKAVADDGETINDIWNDMEPTMKASFVELARWRNDLHIGYEQGTGECWDRMSCWDRSLSDESVLRMDLVAKAREANVDPRLRRIREIHDTAAPKPKSLPNAHVQLAMFEEASNPYVHYSSENFELRVNSYTNHFDKHNAPHDDGSGTMETGMAVFGIDVDPFKPPQLEGCNIVSPVPLMMLLDTQSSHANFGWENSHGAAHNHCVTNVPDTVAVRVTPWVTKLVSSKREIHGGMNVHHVVEPAQEEGLVEVSYSQVMDRSLFAGYNRDGTKHVRASCRSDPYELVGILAVEREKPPKTELTERLPAHGKLSRSDWNALGRGNDQVDSLVSDAQREEIYNLVAAWAQTGPDGKSPPDPKQQIPVTNSQLDAMLRAATGVLRLSLGRLEFDPVVTTKEVAVQECVERTMINLFALREHHISLVLWRRLFDIVNGEAPCAPQAINKQLCTVMKQLKNPEDADWEAAKRMGIPPVSKSECVYLITKYLGQGTAFLASRAAKASLPIDAVCVAETEEATPVACMIPATKRTRFWQRRRREFKEGWLYFEGGQSSAPSPCEELPETLMAGIDKDTHDEYSLVFYYRRAENWKREDEFIEKMQEYKRGHMCEQVEEKHPNARPELSMTLMAYSPFLRREMYNVAADSMRRGLAEATLYQFMGWLTFPANLQEQQTAMRMITDPDVRQDTFESFRASKAFSKRGITAFYSKPHKTKKEAAPVMGGDFNGEDAAAAAPTPEELARLAAEEAERAAREQALAEEARARTAALEAERRERERVAAEEAAAREAAIRERLAQQEAERAARAAEEAAAAREARIARQARAAAEQKAKDAARRTRESDEQTKKKALAKQKSEERKAAKAANNARKKGPSAFKLQAERTKQDLNQAEQQEADAKTAAEAAEAKEAAKQAARAAAAATAQAEAEAKTAAAEARAAARAAERAAERAAILEAEEIAEQAEQAEFELAEEWTLSQAAPPSSPMSTSTAVSTAASTAASTAMSSAWTHGAAEVDAQCVICFDGIRDHLCLPCKHLCVCSRCVASTSLEMCPMCRQPVAEILNVFW
jgi:hypothetical protein